MTTTNIYILFILTIVSTTVLSSCATDPTQCRAGDYGLYPGITCLSNNGYQYELDRQNQSLYAEQQRNSELIQENQRLKRHVSYLKRQLNNLKNDIAALERLVEQIESGTVHTNSATQTATHLVSRINSHIKSITSQRLKASGGYYSHGMIELNTAQNRAKSVWQKLGGTIVDLFTPSPVNLIPAVGQFKKVIKAAKFVYSLISAVLNNFW